MDFPIDRLLTGSSRESRTERDSGPIRVPGDRRRHGSVRSQRVNHCRVSSPIVELTLLLVPYDLGRENVGEGAGPDEILRAGARGVLSNAGHRVRGVQRVRLERDMGNEVRNTFDLASVLSRRVRQVRENNRVPVVLAGGCSAAIGVMSGLSPEGATGLVWFDAHGDANTPETSESGYLDGMPLAVIIGWCWTAMARRVPGFRTLPEEGVIHVGGRDFDSKEREKLYASRIRIVDAQHLRRPGGRAQMADALRQFAKRRSGISLHIDLDVIDKGDGVVNRFSAPGGPPLDEIEAAIRLVASAFEVRAITLCSYDPSADKDRRGLQAGIRVLRAAAETLER